MGRVGRPRFCSLFILDNVQVTIINIFSPVIGAEEIFECVFEGDDMIVNYVVIAF